MIRDPSIPSTAEEIAESIEFWVRILFPVPRYSDWRIGITGDINERMSTHTKAGKVVSGWNYWLARSLNDARRVEHHFIYEKGEDHMWGEVGGKTPGTYVYIFRTTESRNP